MQLGGTPTEHVTSSKRRHRTTTKGPGAGTYGSQTETLSIPIYIYTSSAGPEASAVLITRVSEIVLPIYTCMSGGMEWKGMHA